MFLLLKVKIHVSRTNLFMRLTGNSFQSAKSGMELILKRKQLLLTKNKTRNIILLLFLLHQIKKS